MTMTGCGRPQRRRRVVHNQAEASLNGRVGETILCRAQQYATILLAVKTADASLSIADPPRRVRRSPPVGGTRPQLIRAASNYVAYRNQPRNLRWPSGRPQTLPLMSRPRRYRSFKSAPNQKHLLTSTREGPTHALRLLQKAQGDRLIAPGSRLTH